MEYYPNSGNETVTGTLTAADLVATDDVTVGDDLAVGDEVLVAQGGEVKVFNTADQVTNFERVSLNFTSNVATLKSSKGGTGVSRAIKMASHDDSGVQVADGGSVTVSGGVTVGDGFQFSFGPAGDTVGPKIQGKVVAQVSVPAIELTNNPSAGAFSAASGTQKGVKVSGTRNQSATAAFTALEVDIAGTGGSGAQKGVDVKEGGTSRFYVELAAPAVDGNTVMFLAYHDGASVQIQRVTLGADDSGGAGFRVLRVPN